MTAFLIECPTCATRIPVDSETMRISPVVRLDEVRARQNLVSTCARCNQLISRCHCRTEPA